MEIFTEGDTFADAIKMARDAIDFSKGILTYVDVDFSEYRKKVDTKTVRRNVALPSWLNYEAEHVGINVSMELLDGHKNNNLQVEIINIISESNINSNMELHNCCEEYLNCSDIKHAN